MYYSEFFQKVSSFITVLLAIPLPPDKSDYQWVQKDMQALLISMLKLIFSLSDFDLQCTSVTNDLLNLVFFRFLAFVNYHSWGTGKYFKELDIFLQGQHISHYFGSASISIS